MSRWYVISKSGLVTLCADRNDAEEQAKRADWLFSTEAPHRVAKLVPVFDGDALADIAKRVDEIIKDR